MRSLDAISLAHVVDLVHLGRIGEDTALPIDYQRIVIPRPLPELVEQREIVLREIVAIVVRCLSRTPRGAACVAFGAPCEACSNRSATSLAATRCPLWMGSNVPPITPSRRFCTVCQLT